MLIASPVQISRATAPGAGTPRCEQLGDRFDRRGTRRRRPSEGARATGGRSRRSAPSALLNPRARAHRPGPPKGVDPGPRVSAPSIRTLAQEDAGLRAHGLGQEVPKEACLAHARLADDGATTPAPGARAQLWPPTELGVASVMVVSTRSSPPRRGGSCPIPIGRPVWGQLVHRGPRRTWRTNSGRAAWSRLGSAPSRLSTLRHDGTAERGAASPSARTGHEHRCATSAWIGAAAWFLELARRFPPARGVRRVARAFWAISRRRSRSGTRQPRRGLPERPPSSERRR